MLGAIAYAMSARVLVLSTFVIVIVILKCYRPNVSLIFIMFADNF